MGTSGGGGASVGPRRKDADHTGSSQIAAASGHSRTSSRVGSVKSSHANSRAASFYGPDGAESLLSDAQPLYVSNEPGADGSNPEDAGAVPTLSDDQVFCAERCVAQEAGAGEETKADAGRSNGHGARGKSKGHKKNASSALASSSSHRGAAAVNRNGNGVRNGRAYYGDGATSGDSGTSVDSVVGVGAGQEEEKDGGAVRAEGGNESQVGLESSRDGRMLGKWMWVSVRSVFFAHVLQLLLSLGIVILFSFWAGITHYRTPPVKRKSTSRDSFSLSDFYGDCP